MHSYEWLPTECADKRYPMYIISGQLLLENGESIYIPDRKNIRNGWGEIGSTYLVSEDIKPIPEKLMLSWFSFAENKFYAGKFDLPFDKLTQLFKNGFLSPITNNQATYKRIIVGMAPKGLISLWLEGDGTVLEVGAFQANEADIPWTTVVNNPNISRDTYIQDALEDAIGTEGIESLRKNGIPQNLWNLYREKYRWEPEITGSTPIKMWVHTFNGEKEFIDFSSNEEINKERAIPKGIILYWQATSGKKYKVETTLDEQEIFKAYHKLHDYNPNDSLKLKVEISDMSYSARVFLRNSKFILELKSVQMDVYSAD